MPSLENRTGNCLCACHVTPSGMRRRKSVYHTSFRPIILEPSRKSKMFALYVSTNYRHIKLYNIFLACHVDICAVHVKLCSDCVYSMSADFYVRRSRSDGGSYWDCCQVKDHWSRQHFNLCKRVTASEMAAKQETTVRDSISTFGTWVPTERPLFKMTFKCLPERNHWRYCS